MKNNLKRGYSVIGVYYMKGISISLLLLSFEELLWRILKFPSLASYLTYFLKPNLLKYRNISWVVKQTFFQEIPRDCQISNFNRKITRNSSLKVVLYVRIENRKNSLPQMKGIIQEDSDLSFGMDDSSFNSIHIRIGEGWIPGFLLSMRSK